MTSRGDEDCGQGKTRGLSEGSDECGDESHHPRVPVAAWDWRTSKSSTGSQPATTSQVQENFMSWTTSLRV